MGALRKAWLAVVTPANPGDLPSSGVRPRSRSFNFALQLWLVLGLAICVKMAIDPWTHSNYSDYRVGVTQFRNGQNMYLDLPAVFDYRYGPVFACGLMPLACLPDRLGGLLFAWINLGAMLGAVRLMIARRLLPGDWTPFREGLFLLLVLAGSARMIWSIQINPLVVALVIAGAVAILEERWFLAAFLLALAVHIKVWPIAAALLLIAYRPRVLSWRWVVAMVAVGALPLLVKPWDVVLLQYRQWGEALFGKMQERHCYHDAWTLWETLAPPVPAKVYTILQLGAALATLACCLAHQWRMGLLWSGQGDARGADYRSRVAKQLTFILVLWVSWQMIFGPGTERNTFGVAAPFVSWALITAWGEKRGRVLMATAFLLTTVLAQGWLERLLIGTFPLISVAHPAGVAILAVWSLDYVRRWNGSSEPAGYLVGQTFSPAQ